MVHLEELQVGVDIVIEILGKLAAIAVEAEFPAVDLQHVLVSALFVGREGAGSGCKGV